MDLGFRKCVSRRRQPCKPKQWGAVDCDGHVVKHVPCVCDCIGCQRALLGSGQCRASWSTAAGMRYHEIVPTPHSSWREICRHALDYRSRICGSIWPNYNVVTATAQYSRRRLDARQVQPLHAAGRAALLPTGWDGQHHRHFHRLEFCMLVGEWWVEDILLRSQQVPRLWGE